jgi:AsmA protein
MKKVLAVGAAVVVLLLAAALAIPLFIDANQFRPELEQKLSQSLARQVKVGGLNLGVFSGSVAASDLSISEDPAFGSALFLRASALKAKVELVPLIFSRKLNVTGITVEAPQIDLIQNAAGQWNFSSLGAHPVARTAANFFVAAPAPSPDAASSGLSVADLKISDGRLTLQRIGAKTKPMVLDKVAIEVENFSGTSSFPFSLTASLAAGGSLKLDGNAGPIAIGDAVTTPFDAKLAVAGFDVVTAGALDPTTGMAGVISIDGSAKSQSGTVAVEGKIKAEHVQLSRGGRPANRPLELDFSVVDDLKKPSGTIQRADIHVGGAVARLTGTYNLQNEPASMNVKLTGSKMPLTELAAILPALDIVLPAGAEIEAGTADVNLASQGPLDKLVTTGTIGVENARLAKYDLASKLKTLDALAGIKAEPTTTIQTLRAGVRNSPEGTALDNIQFMVPSIGQITGAGTISPTHALDFKMRVVVQSTIGALASLRSQGGIPFTITGTSEDPSFRPDVKGLATEELKNLVPGGSAAEGLIKGLFGGKKK